MGFHKEALLAPRPTSKLEDHPSSVVRDCLFNIFPATLHIGGRSSIRNLRTRHAVVTFFFFKNTDTILKFSNFHQFLHTCNKCLHNKSRLDTRKLHHLRNLRAHQTVYKTWQSTNSKCPSIQNIAHNGRSDKQGHKIKKKVSIDRYCVSFLKTYCDYFFQVQFCIMIKTPCKNT